MWTNYRDFVTLTTYLGLDKDGLPADQRLQVAVTILFMEMAVSDGRISTEEFEQIIRILDRQYGIGDEESSHLFEIGRLLSANGSRLDESIQRVCERYDSDQLWHLHRLIWKVAEADTVIHPSETKLSEDLRARLGLGDQPPANYSDSDLEKQAA